MKAFEPLTYEELPAGVRSALPIDAEPGLRHAAASGFLPLVTQDLVSCLYYLSHDEDPRVRRQARRSLVELPEAFMMAALDSVSSPKILHWFATRTLPNPEIPVRILLNRNTADETFILLASSMSNPQGMDIIARSEERILRTPEILRAMKSNPNALVSNIRRAEDFFRLQTGRSYEEVLAERGVAPGAEPEHEEAPVLSHIQQLDQALGGLLEAGEVPPDFDLHRLEQEVYQVDELFAEDLLVDPESDLASEARESLAMRINKMSVLNRMRLALKGNIEARTILIKSSNRLIQECVLRNQRITVEEVIKLAKDKAAREELIRLISKNRDWTKNYAVVNALCWNPKTPVEQAAKYLQRLTPKDLVNIARSKQVPGMLAVQARKLVTEKQRYQ